MPISDCQSKLGLERFHFGEDTANEAVASEKRARRTDDEDKDKDLTV